MKTKATQFLVTTLLIFGLTLSVQAQGSPSEVKVAYKWRNWKMHFIQLDSMVGAPAKLNMPHLYNLIEDPKESYPIDKVDVSASWVFPVVLKKVIEFQKTLAIEPPIRLGTPDPYVTPRR